MNVKRDDFLTIFQYENKLSKLAAFSKPADVFTSHTDTYL